MSHLKRLLAPPFWRVAKKESKWVVTPHAGPHGKSTSIPLSIILKHILNVAETTEEAKKIVRKGEILVDGKRRKDYAYPVGMFDAISIPKMKKYYRVMPTEKGLKLAEVSESDAGKKICKIDNKTTLKKGKTQLNLHDGKTILVENGNSYKTGDSLLLELPSLKVIEHLPLEKGSAGVIFQGAGTGRTGRIKDVVDGTIKEPKKILCQVDEEEMIISRDNFVVVGKGSGKLDKD